MVMDDQNDFISRNPSNAGLMANDYFLKRKAGKVYSMRLRCPGCELANPADVFQPTTKQTQKEIDMFAQDSEPSFVSTLKSIGNSVKNNRYQDTLNNVEQSIKNRDKSILPIFYGLLMAYASNDENRQIEFLKRIAQHPIPCEDLPHFYHVVDELIVFNTGYSKLKMLKFAGNINDHMKGLREVPRIIPTFKVSYPGDNFAIPPPQNERVLNYLRSMKEAVLKASASVPILLPPNCDESEYLYRQYMVDKNGQLCVDDPTDIFVKMFRNKMKEWKDKKKNEYS
ncbi:hypothetical protein TRFO_33314 [Tritrichomonas foetus]|uniref:Uncharacterized protein n=1 Tax=Tritrichomonas foetus TaxID=1144522 RepID=A0A1J4JS53_9EUKA|nr:hypothetical protein TRFO_33314 [Tritrichomonas foetus]|eukprot:OHT00077.1 hypothetical protein TRFO_33314 [Tritrichomonas foetus]